MDFHEAFAKNGGQIISGFVGAVIPVALADRITLRRALVLVGVGLAVSYYIAPLVTYIFSLEDVQARSAMGFLVGLIGVQLAQAIINYSTSERIQALLNRYFNQRSDKEKKP